MTTPRKGSRDAGPKILEIPHAITVGDLADRVGANPIEVIKNLMRMGVMASLNDAIDLEVASPIAQFYGYQVEEVTSGGGPALGEKMGGDTESEALQPRPPVVTVLGHVDHGKTSILDAIRKSDVAAGEAGGITQHIGAYQVEVDDHKITFLDTPGHEAFTTLRARGAHVTDIAVLVVAADDGVMPQTIEAINHTKAADVPLIVAINKMDLPNADPERIKRQLSEHEILVEDWGGDILSVPVSAKSGDGLDNLMESILLVAEISEIKADPDRQARGTVIEAQLHANRGAVATVLVQSGTLRTGSTVVAGTTWGRIRAMTDYAGNRVQEAPPSMPVEVLGLSAVPHSGDILEQVESDKAAREIVAERQAAEVQERRQPSGLEQLANQISAGEVRDLNIIIKADVQGSLEAIRAAAERLSNERARSNVLHADVGSITESDVLLATASGATIFGFNTRIETAARRMANTHGIEIRNYSIIYQLMDDLESALRGVAAPLLHEVQEGRAEIKEIFEIKRRRIAGCLVVDGRIRRGALARVQRNNEVIYEGPLSSLRHFRDEVREIAAGQECGIALDEFMEFAEGDVIETFRQEEQPA